LPESESLLFPGLFKFNLVIESSRKGFVDIVKQIGNYGEVFERNVGVNTSLGLERGLNALWTNGGLMYSPPFK
jgi:general L-amino acid transport system substrate-binding protein